MPPSWGLFEGFFLRLGGLKFDSAPSFLAGSPDLITSPLAAVSVFPAFRVELFSFMLSFVVLTTLLGRVEGAIFALLTRTFLFLWES